MKSLPFFAISISIMAFLIPNNLLSQDISHDIYRPTELYQKSSFFIYLDNDKFVTRLLDEDRDYTNGIAFAYHTAWLNKSPLHEVNHWILKKGWSLINSHRDSVKKDLRLLSGGLRLASLAYTPREIAGTAVIFDDRPYASIHFLEFRTHIHDQKLNRVHSLGISYGVLATAAAEFAQRIVHTIGTIRPIPKGWQNQISHPWEPSLLINYQRDRFWETKGTNTSNFFWDLKESISIDLGYRAVASYALTGRWRRSLGQASEHFLFMRIRPYFLAYDATLQGQFRPSVHILQSKDIRNFRAEAAVGLGFRWEVNNNSLYGGYGFYAMTPEAQYPNLIRSHFWGRYWLGWRF